MLVLQGVSKVFRGRQGDVRALDEVDLSVSDGEFVVVKGPSGSGKSTLLLTIAGMIRPTEGRVLFNGADLYAMSEAQRAKFRAEKVGFVFQMFHLVPYLNALDNVILPTRLVRKPAAREEARGLLTRFSMAERLAHRPGELSTGERQRTAVARALVNSPQIVLADEPTGNLDKENGAQIMEYLAEFHRQGGTVVVVTHETWVEEYGQRMVRIHEGRVEVCV